MRTLPKATHVALAFTTVFLLLTAGATGITDSDDDEPVPLLWLVEDPEAPLYPWMTHEQVEHLQAGGSLPLSETPIYDDVVDAIAQARDEHGYVPDPLGELPLPYTRIRPGSPLGITQQACTANYIFQQGDRLAIGNAGHCTQLGRTHQVSILNIDTLSIELLTFGTTIMRSFQGLGTDFALIEIDEEYHHLVHPAIAGLDGPCGWRATIGTGDPIQFHGHGTQGYGYHGQNRHGYIASYTDNHISYHRYPGGAGGDSGSPVRFITNSPDSPTTLLGVAGINTHGSAGNPQMGHGTSAPRIMQLIEQAGVGDWELVNSTTCPPLIG